MNSLKKLKKLRAKYIIYRVCCAIFCLIGVSSCLVSNKACENDANYYHQRMAEHEQELEDYNANPELAKNHEHYNRLYDEAVNNGDSAKMEQYADSVWQYAPPIEPVIPYEIGGAIGFMVFCITIPCFLLALLCLIRGSKNKDKYDDLKYEIEHEEYIEETKSSEN